MKKMMNNELINEFNKKQKRGTIATEMCKRAGTILYLYKYCTPGEIDADRKFYSCMRDTIGVLSKRLEQRC